MVSLTLALCLLAFLSSSGRGGMGQGYLRLEAMEPVEEVGDLAGDSVLREQRDVTLVLQCVNQILALTNMELSPLTPWRGQRECFHGKPSSKITNFISPCHKNTHWLLLESEAGQILQAQCSAVGMFNEQSYPASCGLTNMADMMR